MSSRLVTILGGGVSTILLLSSNNCLVGVRTMVRSIMPTPVADDTRRNLVFSPCCLVLLFDTKMCGPPFCCCCRDDLTIRSCGKCASKNAIHTSCELLLSVLNSKYPCVDERKNIRYIDDDVAVVVLVAVGLSSSTSSISDSGIVIGG